MTDTSHAGKAQTMTDNPNNAEIIRALRVARVCKHPGCHDECGGLQPPIMAVAADALEKAEAENARLRGIEERLKSTVDYCYSMMDRHSNPLPCNAKHLKGILHREESV